MKHARLNVAVLAVALVCGCETAPPPPVTQAIPQPPIATKIPHVTEIHGDKLVDNYYWLRNKSDPRVISYLRAENAYTEWFMRPTAALQDKLYKEMLGRIQETDSSVPYREGDYFYYTRTEEGKQYLIYCRKHGSLNAPEEILLDLNALAKGKKFIDLGLFEVSDDGRRLAYSLDFTGFEEFTLYTKDLRTGKAGAEKIAHVRGAAWAADNQTLFYLTEDDAKRPYRLYRHSLGGSDDALLYEETDPIFSLDIGRSRSKAYIFVDSASKTADEVRYLRANHPLESFRLIAPRSKDHEYSVDHRGDLFYIRTNDKGPNFRLVTAPLADPRRENWTELIPLREDVVLDDAELFADHCVLIERANGLPQISVRDLASGATHRINFPEPAYAVALENNAEFNTHVLRFTYESLTTPPSVFDYDMNNHTRTLLKQQPVKGGYDPARYQTERVFATAADGTPIPISLVYRKDLKRDGGNPLLLDGYGAYGMAEDVWFSSPRLSLLDRGIIFAIAHVRGGGEYGKRWHDAGRMLNKRNTFTDYIAAAEFLIQQRYTSVGQIAASGGSAGGLLMGAVLNMKPHLFRAALVDVPFVDVLNTMLDPSLPLTAGEFEEWGNPQINEQYQYMKSYSPYDNIKPQAYPAMLVQTSLDDSRVMYWEPAKYVAKLRAANLSRHEAEAAGRQTDSNPLLLRVEMTGGHSGQSGRYDQLHERAFNYAWLLTEFGLKP